MRLITYFIPSPLTHPINRGIALRPITKPHTIIGGAATIFLDRLRPSDIHAKQMALATDGTNDPAARAAIKGIFETPEITGAKKVIRKNMHNTTISTANRSHFIIAIMDWEPLEQNSADDLIVLPRKSGSPQSHQLPSRPRKRSHQIPGQSASTPELRNSPAWHDPPQPQPPRLHLQHIPINRRKHNNGKHTTSQVLLVTQVLVSRDNHLEAGSLGDSEQITVPKRMPAHPPCRMHFKPNQKAAKRHRHIIVKQHLHRLSDGLCATAYASSAHTPPSGTSKISVISPDDKPPA